MATSASKNRSAAPVAAPTPASTMALTIAANRVASNKPNVNSYALRNEVLNRERIRYESKGETCAGYTYDQLFENAKGAGNHRRTLARNIDRGSSLARPKAVAAHHVVASQDLDAAQARDHIFACGIGINDIDNGVYLPRLKNVAVPSMPNATYHGSIHTPRYHLAVFARLRMLPKSVEEQLSTRDALRDMKDDMLAGVFPY